MSTLNTTNLKNESSVTNNIALGADGSVNLDAGTLYVDAANDRVGLGTSSPSELLHLSTSSLSDATLIRLDGGSGLRQRFFPSSGTGKYNWQIAVQTNVDNGFEITPSTASGGSTFSTPAVVVKNDGKVGIGTTAPDRKLHVAGDWIRVDDGYGLDTSGGTEKVKLDAGYIALTTASTERMRIIDQGFSKHSNNGAYTSTAGSYHEFNSTINSQCFIVASSNASYSSRVVDINVHRSANAAYSFLRGQSGNFSDAEFNLRGDGNAYADGSWNGGGADYAEYFEWSDGNTTAEDRRGTSVVLDGDKIREAVAGEEPIGVISGNPSVVGDAAWNKWNGKYLRDDFGTYIQEDYEVEDEDGNTVTQQRRKLNPDYDPDVEYISREDRPEWDCVGLMGKLRIRKGQVTGARWIKMRDISDSVEEWLVR